MPNVKDVYHIELIRILKKWVLVFYSIFSLFNYDWQYLHLDICTYVCKYKLTLIFA